MPKLDRYLLSEFAQSMFAATLVLLIVSFGGVFAKVLGDVGSGRVPVELMFPQLGLVLLNWLPLILPLALLIAMMLAVGRLYRDSEMPVIAAIGVGPKRLLRPVLALVVPVVVVVALCSLWLGPWANRFSKNMLNEASRNLLVAGLEPGRFTPLGAGGVIFVGNMDTDGTHFERVFVYREKGERHDVVSAQTGELKIADDGRRFIVLKDGFEVEGPKNDGLEYRLMRYARNEVLLPSGEQRYDPASPEMQNTLALLGDNRPKYVAQLHRRLAPPLLTLAFALLAVPLARSTPRQARYGQVLMGFLAYLVGMFLMLLGTNWIGAGRTPQALGLWWLVLPMLAIGAWLYLRDGRISGPKRSARA